MARLIEIFSTHRAEILSAQTQPDESGAVVGTFYCDMTSADQSAEGIRKEIRKLGFVRSVDHASTERSPIDKFYFPVLIFRGHRALILRLDGVLNIEKRLLQELGSPGGAIMFREGESYAAATMHGYKLVLGSLPLDMLLEVVKDAMRVAGWGLFNFKVKDDGYEITVNDAPKLEGSTEPSRLVCGLVAGLVESLFSVTVKVAESRMDSTNSTLFLRLSKIPDDSAR